MIKALFALTITLQLAAEAEAYKLYTTPDGEFVRWNTAEVELVLDPSLEALGSMQEIETTLRGAIALWETEGLVPVHFEIVQGDCNTLENDGNNCIFACSHPSKCPKDEKDKGASTFLSVSSASGVIQDMDMIFNAMDWTWKNEHRSSDHRSSHALSLRSVAIHELGHALGIDHSSDEEAAMFPSIRVGDEARVGLHNDDIRAAEALYENFVPVENRGSGCSVTGVGQGRNISTWLIIALFWAVRVIRRGRQETR